MSYFTDHPSARRMTAIGIVVIFLATALALAAYVRSNEAVVPNVPPPFVEPSTNLIQRCPDAWYENRMPRVSTKGESVGSSEYLIMDGKRMEISQVDMAWVGANCTVEKKTVY